MTERREKAIRVLDGYSSGRESEMFRRFISHKGGHRAALTDDMLAEFAMFVVEDAKFTDRLNVENWARAEGGSNG